jgi:hypothetical protein
MSLHFSSGVSSVSFYIPLPPPFSALFLDKKHFSWKLIISETQREWNWDRFLFLNVGNLVVREFRIVGRVMNYFMETEVKFENHQFGQAIYTYNCMRYQVSEKDKKYFCLLL